MSFTNFIVSRFVSRLFVTSFLLSLTFFNNVVAATSPADLLQQGQYFYQRGEFVQAITQWKTALAKTQPKSRQHFNTLIRLARAYQKVSNNYTTAYATLQQALSIAKQRGIPAWEVLARSYLGDLLLVMQQPDAARTQLETHLPLARTLGDSLILANFLNNFGNVFSVDQDYASALSVYQEVIEIAIRIDNIALLIQALSNKAQAFLKLDNVVDGKTSIEKAFALVSQLPDSYDKAFSLLNLGQLALRIPNNSPSSINHQTSISNFLFPIFTQVLRLAKQYQNKRLLSYANGFLGQLYERQQRYTQALQSTSKAIFFAQSIPELLYFWEWQQGHILQTQQNLAGATKAYQRALTYLQPIHTELIIGQRNAYEIFYERIRPVYYSLADVLLQIAATTSSPRKKAKLLSQARDTVEKLKTAELQNYFQDECVAPTPTTTLDDYITPHTAVFYPILLPERAELLLSLHDGIHQTVIPVDYKVFKDTVVKFSRNVQSTIEGSFINQAKLLYQWLIAPQRAKLAAYNINTLVIVPDSLLQTIPMAALYDANDKTFLIEHFALATTPGLTLTEPRRLSRKNMSILLSGLSKSVQGFPPLPNVIKEVNTIDNFFKNSTVLIDQAFSVNSINLAMQKKPYEIIHISSHGQFVRNHKDSFLLTYDDKLTMERLENLFKLGELRTEKVELLTLSACQTAVGDERAALGLAGVAIKAGARSALASLWFVDDSATSQLIAQFYQQLQNPTLSKAQALQNAQKKLAAQWKFRHPAYWAPFLLIGNWL